MAATTSERVIIMKQNFMMWHNKGDTIPEIAKNTMCLFVRFIITCKKLQMKTTLQEMNF